MFSECAFFFDTVLEMIECLFRVEVAATYFLELCLCVILCKAILIDPSSSDKSGSERKGNNTSECVVQSIDH